MDGRKYFAARLALCIVITFSSLTRAQYGGGSGSASDPYLIYTAGQMNAIGTRPGDRDKHFKLMRALDLREFTGDRFHLIGTDANAPFDGVFDGNGKTISNFTYACTGGRYIGLFATLGKSGRIENLTLIDPNVQAIGGSTVGALVGDCFGLVVHCSAQGANVAGGYTVGGLAGWSRRLVDCHVQGTVSGWHAVGGLVGCATDTLSNCSAHVSVSSRDSAGGLVWGASGSIEQCYSEGSVVGTVYVGGLASFSSARVANSYSMCDVRGDEGVGGLLPYCLPSTAIIHCYSAGHVQGKRDVGGLVGCGTEGFVVGSFWDVITSDRHSSAGGTGVSTFHMQTEDTFTAAGWDFVGESGNGVEDLWIIEDKPSYPHLAWQLDLPYSFAGGTGTPNDPYRIDTPSQMNALGSNCAYWDKHFKLMQDIDLAAYGESWFSPIGTDWNLAFTGCFDGNGKTIRNFRYVSRVANGIGLFRMVGPGGCIRNLGLIDPNVQATSLVGALVGCNYGTVTACYARGVTVTGTMSVGGLIGSNGGEAGDCYCRGTVRGENEIGGFAGFNSGIIHNSYAVAAVTGAIYVGGLVGYALPGLGRIEASFWDAQAAGPIPGAGGIGMTTLQMQTPLLFLRAGWDFAEETANGTADIWWVEPGKDYPRLVWERVPLEEGSAGTEPNTL